MELEKQSFESDEFVEFVEFENNETEGGKTENTPVDTDKEMDSPAKPENDKLLKGLDSPVKPCSPSLGDSGRQAENDSSDLRPEFCHYRDEGCELAESCLNCPFARCIYDEPGGKQRWLKRLRAREMARLHTIEGKKVKELSEMFGISQRTVQRALKSILGSTNGKAPSVILRSEATKNLT